MQLQSLQTRFMKGPHWVERLEHKQAELRSAAAHTRGKDRAFLTALAEQVAERRWTPHGPAMANL